MEKDINNPKFSVEIKQTEKGSFYLGSLKINAESIEEIERLMDSYVNLIKTKLNSLNKTEQRFNKFAFDPDEELDSEDAILFEKLRELRIEIAREERMPAYVIFHDSTIKGMAIFRPKNREEFLRVPGVGQTKYEKYGEEFLKIIKAFEEHIDRVNHYEIA